MTNNMGLLSFLKKKSNTWVKCKVSKTEALSHDFKVISLQPSDDKSLLDFIPGQYVTIEHIIEGKSVRRSYSICGNTEDAIQIGVKKIENGLMSSFLHSEVEIGSELTVHTAEGNFTLGTEKNVCALVAGSGITPIASMIQSNQKNVAFRIFYNVKKKEDVLFQSLLGQTNATIYLSQEISEGYLKGRLDYEALIEEIKNDLSILQSDVFLLCGPNGFMDEIDRCLKFFGVDEGKIRREFFIPPTSNTEDKSNKFKGTCEVTVMLDGQEHQLSFEVGKKTLLEHFEEAKIDPPYSCRGGVCSSCKAKVKEGKVKMRQNYTLTDKEVSNGYVLTCQSEPDSEKIILSFDE